MTTSEAIKWFENRKSGSTMPGARMVLDMALEALREKAARENPEPLTLEELRQMDGEPVWCRSCLNGRAEWTILRAVEMSKTWFVALGGATQGFGDKDTYGKTWLAYREKPKEE